MASRQPPGSSPEGSYSDALGTSKESDDQVPIADGNHDLQLDASYASVLEELTDLNTALQPLKERLLEVGNRRAVVAARAAQEVSVEDEVNTEDLMDSTLMYLHELYDHLRASGEIVESQLVDPAVNIPVSSAVRLQSTSLDHQLSTTPSVQHKWAVLDPQSVSRLFPVAENTSLPPTNEVLAGTSVHPEPDASSLNNEPGNPQISVSPRSALYPKTEFVGATVVGNVCELKVQASTSAVDDSTSAGVSQHDLPGSSHNPQIPTESSSELIRSQSRNESTSSSTGNKMHPSFAKAIKLPKFNGDPKRYKEFSDLFTTFVDSKDDTPLEKFWILRNALTGNALSKIRHLNMTAENYETAKNRLREEFGEPRLAVNSRILGDSEVLNTFYMDDCVFGANSIEEAQHKIKLMFNVFQDGHFPLRKWHCNSCPLGDFIQEISPIGALEIYANKPDAKFLGISWNQQTDNILCVCGKSGEGAGLWYSVMPTVVPADSVSSLTSRSLGDPYLEIAWLSTVTLEQYEKLIERDDSFASCVLAWLKGWFSQNARALRSDEDYLRGIALHNFMEKLDTGVILCHLAELIVAQSIDLGRPILRKCVPVFNFKPWEAAKPKSFYARDNVENFTRWCRRFGVNESVLFESDGLVMHQAPRYVLLVLLELCRLCAQRGIDSPALHENRLREKQLRLAEEQRRQRLEREHEVLLRKREEEEETARNAAEQRRLLVEQEKGAQIRKRAALEEAERIRKAEELRNLEELRRIEELERAEKRRLAMEAEARRQLQEELDRRERERLERGISTPVCFAESVSMPGVDETHLSDSTNKSKNRKSRLPVPTKNGRTEPPLKPTSVLDEKVNTIVNKVLQGAKLHRLAEGKYLINGRTFLVRLLNDRQVMVRVGGGWKSLEEMLRPRVLRVRGEQTTTKSASKVTGISKENVECVRKALGGSLTSVASSVSNSSRRSRIPVGDRPRWN
ncbi:uncharacterized protein LOC114828100 [Galendromus occidentalis]|uniref:Uncharacterized protein LOC114828100 n=1 Tax=Galendromus occidentalis TaxID=34638 RepID=A0AAJ7SDX8_9ACAR|nr:uncharacterized protein LOC114828100 [Galendromus occidentalis]